MRLYWQIISLAGAVDSAYLSSEALTSSLPPFCTVGSFNCVPVLSSPYSKIFGIPVAILGLAWFVLMFFFLSKKELPSISFPVWIAGVFFASYLIYAEFFLIHSICPYCTVAHLLGFILGIPIVREVLSP